MPLAEIEFAQSHPLPDGISAHRYGASHGSKVLDSGTLRGRFYYVPCRLGRDVSPQIFPQATYAPKDRATRYASRCDPITDGAFRPYWDGKRADVLPRSVGSTRTIKEMSMMITSVRLNAVVQVSDTRLSSLDQEQRTIHEDLLKSTVVLGDKARFVIGWTGYATPNIALPSDTRDWLFKALCEMNAPWRSGEEIMHLLRVQATAYFAALPRKDDRRTHFVLGGWEIPISGKLSPFVGVVSNFATPLNETPSALDSWHHIPKYEASATAAPEFQSWIQRFRNGTDRHYLVNVMGDYKSAKLQQGFRGLEGLLKQQASVERIGTACRQIILQASEYSLSIGRNVITLEMDSTGKNHCSYYSEQGTDIILVPDCISTLGCYTRATVTQTADGKTRVHRGDAS